MENILNVSRVCLTMLIRIIAAAFLLFRVPDFFSLLPAYPIPLKQTLFRVLPYILQHVIPFNDWTTFTMSLACGVIPVWFYCSKHCGTSNSLTRDILAVALGIPTFTGLLDHALIWQPPSEHLLIGKVALVTGGSSGIGFQTALGLHRLGANVVITCRSSRRCQSAVEQMTSLSKNNQEQHENITCLVLDLSSPDSIRACAQGFRDRFDRLDVLVLNAGAIATGEEGRTVDGLEWGLGTMHVGHTHLFLLLEDLLLGKQVLHDGPGRVVITASVAHLAGRFHPSLLTGPHGEGDLRGEVTPSNHTPDCCLVGCSYGRAKLANVFLAQQLARRNKQAPDQRELIAVSVGLGFVATGFLGPVVGPGLFVDRLFPVLMRSPKHAARLMLFAAVAPAAETPSGAYVDTIGRVLDWHPGSDWAGADTRALSEALWNATLDLVARREPDLLARREPGCSARA